jgi:shikimate dehydrogenase
MKKSKPAKDVYAAADLENWEKATAQVDPPIRLAVLGDPVAHSFSPQIQNAALHDCKIPMQYARMLVRPNELSQTLAQMRDLKFVGVNLTVPHKIAALEHIDNVDANAKRIGAVNTVKVEDGKTMGFNTDGKGFVRAVRQDFSVDLRDLRVMVLGAGGAARAIALQCAREGCERLVVTNRTFARGQELADQLRDYFVGPRVFGPVPRLQAVQLEESAIRFQIGHVDLLVNATPVGLNRAEASPIPARLLAPHLMIYDTIYSPQRTPFISAAIEAGARSANGLSMLLHQAALAFEIWFDREAPMDVMRRALS